jgi:hypothetical protein
LKLLQDKSLHTKKKSVKIMSLKQWVIEVTDVNVLNREEENFASKKDCLFCIEELAVNCSAESPEENQYD